MYKKEIALNDARRVDQRHRRQAEDAELAEGRARAHEPLAPFVRRLDAARPHASLFTQLGVFGASTDGDGVGRVFRPSPTLTDDSMIDLTVTKPAAATSLTL